MASIANDGDYERKWGVWKTIQSIPNAIKTIVKKSENSKQWRVMRTICMSRRIEDDRRV